MSSAKRVGVSKWRILFDPAGVRDVRRERDCPSTGGPRTPPLCLAVNNRLQLDVRQATIDGYASISEVPRSNRPCIVVACYRDRLMSGHERRRPSRCSRTQQTCPLPTKPTGWSRTQKPLFGPTQPAAISVTGDLHNARALQDSIAFPSGHTDNLLEKAAWILGS